MRKLFAAALMMAASLAHAQGGPSVPGPSKVQPGCYHVNEKMEREVGYCQARRHGNMLYISGHTAGGEMPAAVKTVYTRLGRILAAHGLTFKDVVKENVFTTNMDALVKAADVRLPFYDNHYPAASWIGVQRLFMPEFVIEVELVAAFPDGK
ncbi:RidA family protein [Pseudoduganella sp. OTU4001]|uniref:RidA family protein n=1 Tax=Pseudoduganella sp. OTU4001 TaxID=3043854 RepID=UPI00313D788D